MEPITDTLNRPRYTHHATTKSSDIANLIFETGTKVNVLKTDPALKLLSRGDHVTFGQKNMRDIHPGLQITIYAILRIERQQPVYVTDYTHA